MKQFTLPCVLGVALLAACKPQAPAPDTKPTGPDSTAQPAATFQPAIHAADFAQHVRTLASDEFEGRGPGSAGEEKSVAYIEAQFKRLGLKPGNGDSYFQTVPMVETVADENVSLKLDVAGKPRELKFGTDMV